MYQPPFSLTNELEEAARTYHPAPEAEALALIGQAQRGDRVAAELLIKQNVRLVLWRVSRYRSAIQSDALEEGDLFQAGCVAVARAIELFDFASGVRFSTYATHAVDRSISRCLDKDDRAIRVPVGLLRRARKVGKAMATPDAGAEDLQAATGLSARQIERAQSIPAVALSLDAPTGDGREQKEFFGRLSDFADILLEEIDRERLLAFIRKRLDDPMYTTIIYRFGFDPFFPRGATFAQIGDRLGVSPKWARKIFEDALDILRQPENRGQLRQLLYGIAEGAR